MARPGVGRCADHEPSGVLCALEDFVATVSDRELSRLSLRVGPEREDVVREAELTLRRVTGRLLLDRARQLSAERSDTLQRTASVLGFDQSTSGRPDPSAT